jgi:hypothetical protein
LRPKFRTVGNTVKETCHEISIFGFFHKTTPSGFQAHGLKRFAYGFVFTKIFNYEIDFFGGQWSHDTTDHWWAVSMTPLTGGFNFTPHQGGKSITF